MSRKRTLCLTGALALLLLSAGCDGASGPGPADTGRHDAGSVDADTTDVSDVEPPPRIDRSFGEDGFAFLDLSAARAITLTSEGLVVLGCNRVSILGERRIFLARYDRRGALDPRFGEDGKVFIDAPCVSTWDAHDLVAQPDGKLVAAVTIDEDPENLARVFRFEADGTLDSSFGDAGAFELPLAGSPAISDLLEADGHLLVAGDLATASVTSLFVSRLRPDGTLDADYGQGGISVNTPTVHTRSAAGQLDGKMVVASYVRVPSQEDGAADFALYRFGTDGTLDPEFGIDGVSVVPMPHVEEFRHVAVAPDGKIVATGDSTVYGSEMAGTSSGRMGS